VGRSTVVQLVTPEIVVRAAYRVGYHDTSHFNRKYKSFFGLPPMRDIERLRRTTKESVSLATD